MYSWEISGPLNTVDIYATNNSWSTGTAGVLQGAFTARFYTTVRYIHGRIAGVVINTVDI